MIPPEVAIHARLTELLDGTPNDHLRAFEEPASRARVLSAARDALNLPDATDGEVETSLRGFLTGAEEQRLRGRFLADLLSAYGPVVPVAAGDLYGLWLNRSRVQGRLAHAVMAGVRYALGSPIPDDIHEAVSDTEAEREERAYQSRKAARSAALAGGGL